MPLTMPAQPKVIVASPDADVRSRIQKILISMHWPAEEASGGADALNKLEGKPQIEAVLLDHWLPDLDVDDLEHSLRVRFPAMDVVLVDLEASEPSHSNRAVIHPRTRELLWALRKETHSAKVVPVETVDSAYTSAEPECAPNEIDVDLKPLPGMIGNSRPMLEVARFIRLVTKRNSSVLITGETGTGKEVIARAVHELSARASRPMVVVNCAAIPEPLLESELFGYSRGAFTGAMQPKMGRIHSADGGTLFLDEIGELPPGVQAKLLRFLQEGEVQRLGSNEVIKIDVRVIAATNVDLRTSGDKGFRQDLYYRLAVFPIELPPLRNRGNDILALANHFLADLCVRERLGQRKLSEAVQNSLMSHPWNGNVRELQHAIERAFILAEDETVLTLEHLPALTLTGESKSSLNFA